MYICILKKHQNLPLSGFNRKHFSPLNTNCCVCIPMIARRLARYINKFADIILLDKRAQHTSNSDLSN